MEDFEQYEVGAVPRKWKRPHKESRSFLVLPDTVLLDDDFAVVTPDGRSNVVRIYSRDNTEQIALINGEHFDWRLDQYPLLSWRWKAITLPQKAREDKRSLNDSGGALYVTFDSFDWLGRPRTIKYVFSSSLPNGTSITYGALKVLVVSSPSDSLNKWITVQRNVAEDYQKLFGRKPPDKPGYIMLWGDSDNTNAVSDVLFDDLIISTIN